MTAAKAIAGLQDAVAHARGEPVAARVTTFRLPPPKALSIRQPYAFAVVMGFKPVENRERENPNDPFLKFRGPVLIHASLKEEREDVDDVLRLIAEQSGGVYSYAAVAGLYHKHRALGAIVGAATITDCITKHPSRWFNGPYAFVFENPKFCRPVECKGALGFFTVPADTLTRVRVPPYWPASVETSR